MELSDDQLAEWERLAAAATPGPWRYEARTHRGSVYDHGERIAECWCGAAEGHGGDNAAFIAAARTAVPALVAEVLRLRAERDAAVVRWKGAVATGERQREELVAIVHNVRETLDELVAPGGCPMGGACEVYNCQGGEPLAARIRALAAERDAARAVVARVRAFAAHVERADAQESDDETDYDAGYREGRRVAARDVAGELDAPEVDRG